jgi:hypothetical protein
VNGLIDFGYGGFSFSWGDHICGIFDSHAQQMEIMGAFISTGLAAEQRCVWISPPPAADALRLMLADMGGDLATLEASSQLLILDQVEFYLRGGVFDPEHTVSLITSLLQDNRREGYATMRFANDVSWLSQEAVDPTAWEIFESRLTHEISSLPMVMVCQYNRHQVSGDMIVTALETHPTILLGDRFRRNPFFSPVPIGPTDSREIM